MPSFFYGLLVNATLFHRPTHKKVGFFIVACKKIVTNAICLIFSIKNTYFFLLNMPTFFYGQLFECRSQRIGLPQT